MTQVLAKTEKITLPGANYADPAYHRSPGGPIVLTQKSGLSANPGGGRWDIDKKPVKKLLMKWAQEDKTPEQIEAMEPKNIAEMVAKRMVMDVLKAEIGTKMSVSATNALKVALDGKEAPSEEEISAIRESRVVIYGGKAADGSEASESITVREKLQVEDINV